MSKNRKPDLGQTNPFLDEAYLGGVKKKREKISLNDLSSVENARKMTLCDLVNLVNKCAKTFRAKPATASSKLRTEAAKFYRKHRKWIKELHTPNLMTPGLLTVDNVDFRPRFTFGQDIDTSR